MAWGSAEFKARRLSGGNEGGRMVKLVMLGGYSDEETVRLWGRSDGEKVKL